MNQARHTYKEPPVANAPWLRNGEPGVKVKKRRGFGWWLKRTLLFIFIGLLLGGGIFAWELYRTASKLTGNSNLFSLLPKPLKETNGRVNILLAGYSTDDPGHAGADLTDSIMVLSIDPANKSATVISVPRDLYVKIPGYGYSKINAAYKVGQSTNFVADGYAAGGMGQLEKIISQDFGVQFNYTALINYTAFRDAVNAVGGVTITIKSPDPRGLYDPYTNLKLPNGQVTLNGQQALDLARARGDGPGSYGFPRADFDRTAHQQLILTAVKDKAAGMNLVFHPIKLLQITNAVGNNVKTDMLLGELETLYGKTKSIPDNKIADVTLNNYQDKAYVRGYTTYDGQSALIPTAGLDDYSAIQNLVNNLMTSN